MGRMGSGGRSRKGVLLTLFMIILFILMMAEIITYVTLSTNYDSIAASGAQELGEAATKTALAAGARNFLHEGLLSADGALLGYESNPVLLTVGGNIVVRSRDINSTAYFLRSLLYNGTVYGVNMSKYMGTATLASYINYSIVQARQQGVNLTITNSTIAVYQADPFSINATYSALYTSTSASGTFVYPVSVTTGITLNGTTDPIGIMDGNAQPISGQASYPVAVKIGGQGALSGSTSQFMFLYGTVILYPSSAPTCSNIGVTNNQFYILAVQDAANLNPSACGDGGLVANIMPTVGTPNVPFLQFNSIVFNYIQNDSQVLLSGPNLALYNMSQLRLAVQSGGYYQSPYTPSYFDNVQRTFTQRDGEGMFSFGPLMQEDAYFGGSATHSNVLIPNSLTLNSPFSLSMWFNSNLANTVAFSSELVDTLQPNQYSFDLKLCGEGGCVGTGSGLQLDVGNGAELLYSEANAISPFTANTWYNVVVSVNGSAARVYLDGGGPGIVPYAPNSVVFAGPNNRMVIGAAGSGDWFNGKIADVQLYDANLSATQAQQLYMEGIGAPPISTARLVGWWPLDGNTNDYSGYGNNGVATAVTYGPVTGYFGDPIYAYAPLLQQNASAVEGVLGCINPAMCADTSVQQLYVGNYRLSYSGGSAMNETATLGMPNGAVPPAADFISSGAVTESQPLNWMESTTQPYTFSIWVYPNRDGVVIDENNTAGWHKSWLEISGGKYYAQTWTGLLKPEQLSGALPYNTWTDLAFSYNSANGGTFNGYVNGVQTINVQSYGARLAPSGNAYYMLGQGDTVNMGSGAPFSGMLSDFQTYNVDLNPSQVMDLYLNNSVPNVPSNMAWPLSQPYAGMFNTSAQSNGNDFATFWSGGMMCNQVNSITDGCGVQYAPG